ncbi:MAG: sensor histidine kinase [Deltaproteobacteria bacterium]|jgi:PAS domain S-box-containing protein|nr:sensor histidine kinase [Deltaproteobacteria bacterium]
MAPTSDGSKPRGKAPPGTRHPGADHALQESEKLYRTLVESVADGIAITVGTDRVFVNKAFLDIHGLKDRSQAIGVPVDHFILPEYKEAVRKRILAREEGHDVETVVEYKINRLDGEIRTLQASVVTIRYEGKPAVLSVLRDITEQKRAEEEIRKLNEALEEKIAELKNSNHDLEAFNYTVSHDLRVPLTAIGGFARRIAERHGDDLDPKVLQMLNIIRSNVDRMEQLINDLLSYARLGRQEIGRSLVPIDEIVRAILDELRTVHPGRKIDLRVGALPDAHGDASMLRQVFLNLLSNAFKFTKHREIAHIEVGGSAKDQENLYWVKDDGIGFDPAETDRLFGLFQRLHGSNEFEGTGIGLAIVKRIVEFHGGRVWAEGKPDAGATFYFTLPTTSK